ncbi:MAG: hypothetical protein Q8O01_04815, partial [Candidatus Omnitrophota bacterium]|nr:hypothetical protein [Candidatus Omnitrophota bacterium]
LVNSLLNFAFLRTIGNNDYYLSPACFSHRARHKIQKLAKFRLLLVGKERGTGYKLTNASFDL